MGRKKIILTDKQIGQIKSMAGMGFTQAEIADALGISLATLKNKRGEFPEVDSHWRQGKVLTNVAVSRNLLYLANPPWPEGSDRPVREPNLQAIIHFERTRRFAELAQVDRDGNTVPPAGSGEVRVVNFYLPHNGRDPLPPGMALRGQSVAKAPPPDPSANGNGHHDTPPDFGGDDDGQA